MTETYTESNFSNLCSSRSRRLSLVAEQHGQLGPSLTVKLPLYGFELPDNN